MDDTNFTDDWIVSLESEDRKLVDFEVRRSHTSDSSDLDTSEVPQTYIEKVLDTIETAHSKEFTLTVTTKRVKYVHKINLVVG